MGFLHRASQPSKQTIAQLDKEIAEVVRSICCLTNQGSLHYINGAVDEGCLGIIKMVDEYNIQAVSHGFRLLTSPNLDIQQHAWLSLKEEAMRWYKRTVTKEEMLSFLNGSTEGELSAKSSGCGHNATSIWSKIRKCNRTLSKDIGLQY